MFHVQVANFRCFYEPLALEVLPVTFLVGENSAGKTTFMAAVRLLVESFLRSPQNLFNRDPYYLGGFDQIAHYRGGVRGRAKQFCLGITVPASETTGARGKKIPATTHKLTFVKGSSPQPELSLYEFSTPDAKVILNLEDKNASVKLIGQGKEKVRPITPPRLPPIALLRKDLSYLRYVFDDIAFGSRQTEKESGDPDAKNGKPRQARC
ncbi:MAG TPA: hypothetical protein VMU87_20150 [Stellaceae bacterium]|nr:hypothetical protein [Stellaceae bacterium]